MSEIIKPLSKETSKFILTYRYNVRLSSHCLRVKSKSSGGHFAEHTRYNALDDSGSIIESRYLDTQAARFILENFEERGSTASFDIYISDLAAGKLLKRNVQNVDPKDVRHKLTNTEKSYTSTGDKLSHHWPIFKKLKETGYGSIIRATLTLHQVCSSRCHFCSTIARNKKDSITLEEAKEFVSKLYFDQAQYNKDNFSSYNDKYKEVTGSDIRLRGLILSGGGQPNLWPHFTEFVEWLSTLDIDVGLITNGFPKNIPDEIYNKFTWIRISVTPEDASAHYVDGKFNKQRLPDNIKNNPDITVGYSYVYGPWTDDDIINRIKISMEDNGFDYCRMLTDCNLTRSAQLRAHQDLSDRLFRLSLITEDGSPTDRFFHQLKYHGTPKEANELFDQGQCFLQSYNVFWDTTGHEDNGKSYCYACDSITVLAEESSDNSVSASERKFDHEKWGTVDNTEVERLFTEVVTSFFDPRESCTACLFMNNNSQVKSLASKSNYKDLKTLPIIDHVNFP
jgi:organic radical activating enzyme